MKLLSKKIFSAVSILLMVILITPLVSFGDTVVELQNKIDQKNNEIDKLEAEIAQYQKDLVTIGDQKDTLANTVKSLELTSKKLSADISVTQKKIESQSLTIQGLEGDIYNTDESLNQNYSAIEKNIRFMNISENITLLEKILTSRDLAEAVEEYGSISQFTNAVHAHTNSLKDLKQHLTDSKIKEELAKSDLEKLKKELSYQKTIADNNKTEQNKLLKATQNKESEYQKILAQRIKQKEEFEQEIFEYESSLEYLLDPSKLPKTGVGALKWPLQSIYITQYFGKTIDAKRLYVSGTHNGVDFRAAVGTKVFSVRSGVVKGIGDTDAQSGCYSYGKWILIEHDNGVSTIYGHMSAITVKAGDSVTTGQVIGYSGNTGYTTGPHLHLTVVASDAVSVQKYTASKYCKLVYIPVASSKAYLDPMLYLGD